jgi:hypothetical protein
MVRSSAIELVASAVIAPLFVRYALKGNGPFRIVIVVGILLMVGTFALAWHHAVSPSANGCGIAI